MSAHRRVPFSELVLGRVRGAFASWAHHPPISSRHEIVLALALSAVASGLGGLAGPDVRPASITQSVPHPVAIAWFAILLLGGTSLLVSARWPRDRLEALRVEGPAYFLLGGGALVYALCLIAIGHGTAFVVACGYICYGTASWTRTLRIYLYIHYLRGFTGASLGRMPR